jgi:TRAP-type uncharacterized transport system fused permease subunit
VAAVTSKIANASFLGTLGRALLICSPLFVLMAAMFVRPELVQTPGIDQLGAMVLVLSSSLGLAFAFQARFSDTAVVDITLRVLIAAFAMLALFHPHMAYAIAGCVGVVAMIGYWIAFRRTELLAQAHAS